MNELETRTNLKMNCCEHPRANTPFTDLGHAESFEYCHFFCKECGVHWLDVFCVATGVSDIERISPEQANIMLNSHRGAERKGIMKAWGREHL